MVRDTMYKRMYQSKIVIVSIIITICSLLFDSRRLQLTERVPVTILPRLGLP